MMRFAVIGSVAFMFVTMRAASAQENTQADFFEQKIRPVLVEKCYSCHTGSEDEVEAKLWLDSKAGWSKGGQSGPAIVPGKPDASLLVHAIRGTDKVLAMPPGEKLPDNVIADFQTWIRLGAFDPRESNQPLAPVTKELSAKEKWVFSKPIKPIPPEVHYETWLRQPIDNFVLSRLESIALSPAPESTPQQLVRRLYFDLTGLPPTPDEAEAFIVSATKDRQQAVVTLVDDLLSRPSYGEKWGRYWLDCVRFTDSHDSRSGDDLPDSWRYRDWVVSSFNNDLPYNSFLKHQIAGDLLGAQQNNPALTIPTGMYAFGNWGNGDSDKRKVYTDIVDDQIDVTTRAMLGLTLSCARCHDHKFDQLSTADYYAMAGFFFSSRILNNFADPTAGETLMRIDILSSDAKAKREQLQAELAQIDQKLNQALTPLPRREENVAGRPDLVAWKPASGEHPALVINSGSNAESFATVTMPPRSICLHPSPTQPATIVWRSSVEGEITISMTVQDVDGTCGDGIAWTLRHKDQTLFKEDVANAAEPRVQNVTTTVNVGELVRLAIAPQQTYFCDSTLVDMAIEHTQTGQSWHLWDSLLDSKTIPDSEKSDFLICSGDAPQLVSNSDTELLARQKELTSQLPADLRCLGLQDGGVPGTPYAGFHDAPIHVRGNYNRLATLQPRGFPTIFKAATPSIEGSGRLALADWITSNDNPLTARVLVNRLWQHHFGRGIVVTANDFGNQGTPATHPELLDWLAVTFMENGWSIKHMHRLICTSSAYQQSSTVTPHAWQLDPENLLYSRQSRRKLTAEELRDAMLAITGDLNKTLGGPAVNSIDSPRRTLYLRAVRSDRTTYQLLFDGADPTRVVEQRNESLVAPQALWLLNQPFTTNQSDKLHALIEKVPGQPQKERLIFLIDHLFTRPPQEGELTLLTNYLNHHNDATKAWRMLVHSLLCSNEFLFVD